MKIQILSDIHTEFMKDISQNVLSEIFHTKGLADVLVFAGDYHPKHKKRKRKDFEFFNYLVDTGFYKHVVLVLGNHDYWYDSVELSVEKIRAVLVNPNVHLLENSSINIDGQVFHGCTMWTDFDKENPLTMSDAEMYMNDYRQIRINKHRASARPSDILKLHKQSRQFIINVCQKGDIIVTHHLPTHASINKSYVSNNMNGSYASDLSMLMEECEPSLWIHGHTHRSCDYEVYNTRVVCNPFGYFGVDKNPAFNDNMIIEI